MGDPEVGIGHVARRLFMSHRHGFNLILPIVQGIEKSDNPVPAKAEYVRNLFLHEIFRNNVSSPHPCHDIPLHSAMNQWAPCS